MKFKIKTLLRCFDERRPEMEKRATPIVGFLGEDLNASVFKHYAEFLKAKADIRQELVNTGKQKGVRLDRWILWQKKGTRPILYQTEIKNWSVYAINAYKSLPVNALEKIVKDTAKRNWGQDRNEHYFKSRKPNKLNKVFVKMEVPKELNKYKRCVKPLVIHWRPTNPNGTNPFFTYPVKRLKIGFKSPFKTFGCFSVSLYLRRLLKNGKNEIILEMPEVDARMAILKNLIK